VPLFLPGSKTAPLPRVSSSPQSPSSEGYHRDYVGMITHAPTVCSALDKELWNKFREGNSKIKFQASTAAGAGLTLFVFRSEQTDALTSTETSSPSRGTVTTQFVGSTLSTCALSAPDVTSGRVPPHMILRSHSQLLYCVTHCCQTENACRHAVTSFLHNLT
jgi:hypothetical protein